MADTLVLNADGQPISYLPLSAIQWKEAITYMWLDKCNVLEWYDDWVVRSSSWETRVPAVIIMKEMYRRRRTPRFSKTNVYLRDLYTCQYCGEPFSRNSLTLDHVIPISRGGRTNWENIVTACNPCNSRKGNSLTPKPKIQPYQPDYYELVNTRKQMNFDIRHPSWELFLK
jgi:5-methylcytosine-specific restriction endonuclease McrA